MTQRLVRVLVAGMVGIASAVSLIAQTSGRSVETVLAPSIQPADITAYQLQRYLMKRIPKLPSATDPAAWKAEAKRLRKHMLDDIAFHGWPREWVDSSPKFTDMGTLETGKGYRLRKLKFEIVPGYSAAAILYEPEALNGRAPAILNVNGHDPSGKAAEYKQKRCINFAKRGILALSLEWPGFGELSQPENAHDYGAHLDLVGYNALGFFYLAMRRGLDYLASLPQVDSTRLGVTGLSGGGWQTITLSALDERVAAMVEVAGFGALQSNLTHPVDTDEIEENPTDFALGEDYTFLAALRAPRPTLFIHNAEDDCCFRAALVKPYIYEQIKPFFQLMGHEDAFAWYENRDPGTHNYQLDNREQAYKFFDQTFHLNSPAEEIPSDDEIKTPQELTVGMPADNLTIAGLARRLAQGMSLPEIPTDGAARKEWAVAERKRLQEIIRLDPVTVDNAWRMWNSKNKGLETLSYRFDFSNGLSATGLWLKAIAAQANATPTIVLNDKGKKAAGEVVSDLVNRGGQVLALEPIFNGATSPQLPDPTDWEMLVATMGDRPLGLQVAQLLGAAHWFRENAGGAKVRIETSGMRTQVVALVAAALEPDTFSEVVSDHGLKSLGYLLDTPVPLRSAPELFCLDLYKYFDIDRIAALAAPAQITTTSYVEPGEQKKKSE